MENPVFVENWFEWVLTNFSLSRHYESSLPKSRASIENTDFSATVF